MRVTRLTHLHGCCRGNHVTLPIRNWTESGLPDPLLKAVEKMGYKTPSPIQMAAIPLGLQQRDVIGIAETGVWWCLPPCAALFRGQPTLHAGHCSLRSLLLHRQHCICQLASVHAAASSLVPMRTKVMQKFSTSGTPICMAPQDRSLHDATSNQNKAIEIVHCTAGLGSLLLSCCSR